MAPIPNSVTLSNLILTLRTETEFALNQFPRAIKFETELPRLETGKLYGQELKVRY